MREVEVEYKLIHCTGMSLSNNYNRRDCSLFHLEKIGPDN